MPTVTVKIEGLDTLIKLLDEIKVQQHQNWDKLIYLETRVHDLGNIITGRLGITEAEVIIRQVVQEELKIARLIK